MDFSEDLTRVLWHEFGHFCIDLLDSELNLDFTISNFWISYHESSESKQKWGGGVKIEPSIKWSVLFDDLNKTSFSLLSLISGCVFETVFKNRILKNTAQFEDCFSTKGAGSCDFISFYDANNEFRKKYFLSSDLILFSEVKFFEIYYKSIIKNESFL